jgi:hypothetical protein
MAAKAAMTRMHFMFAEMEKQDLNRGRDRSTGNVQRMSLEVEEVSKKLLEEESEGRRRCGNNQQQQQQQKGGAKQTPHKISVPLCTTSQPRQTHQHHPENY